MSSSLLWFQNPQRTEEVSKQVNQSFKRYSVNSIEQLVSLSLIRRYGACSPPNLNRDSHKLGPTLSKHQVEHCWSRVPFVVRELSTLLLLIVVGPSCSGSIACNKEELRGFSFFTLQDTGGAQQLQHNDKAKSPIDDHHFQSHSNTNKPSSRNVEMHFQFLEKSFNKNCKKPESIHRASAAGWNKQTWH